MNNLCFTCVCKNCPRLTIPRGKNYKDKERGWCDRCDFCHNEPMQEVCMWRLEYEQKIKKDYFV